MYSSPGTCPGTAQYSSVHGRVHCSIRILNLVPVNRKFTAVSCTKFSRILLEYPSSRDDELNWRRKSTAKASSASDFRLPVHRELKVRGESR